MSPRDALEEVSQLSAVPPPATTTEALGMLRAAMRYLTTTDAAQMAADEQAGCLQALEHITAMGTTARTSILAAFTSGQGYCADADYSPKAWLINKTRVTKAVAVSYTAWVQRAAAHPEVALPPTIHASPDHGAPRSASLEALPLRPWRRVTAPSHE